MALEAVRVDLADGMLDGKVDHRKRKAEQLRNKARAPPRPPRTAGTFAG
jgi:hypothetical protein